MVDNATFRFSKEMTLTDFKSYIKKLKTNNYYMSYKSDNKNNKKYVFLICKNDYDPELKPHSIKLTVEYSVHLEEMNITIQNSLRKWYFSKKSTQDFSKSAFTECLKLLSKKIFLEYNDLCKSKITNLELGVTLKLDSEFRLFMATLLEHQRLKNRHSINNETIMFDGENKCLKLYNKSKEIYMHTDLSKKGYKKISDRYFILRIEIDFKKISGVSFSKENLESIEHLLKNWEKAFEYLTDQVKEIKTIDFISPKIVSKLEKGTDKDIYNWLIFVATEHIKLDKLWMTINDISERPHNLKKRIEMIIDEYRKVDAPSFTYAIRKELRKKHRIIMV